MINNIFDKNSALLTNKSTSDSAAKNENIPDQQLAEELYTLLEKLENEKYTVL